MIALTQKKSKPFHVICYFGHHRSSSSYIRSILESIAVLCGKSTGVIHQLDEYPLKKNPDLLIATNGNMQHLDMIPFEKAFHVIRDPRDIVVSSYFSHLISHKTDVWQELEVHRLELKKMTQEEGIIHEIEICRKQQFLDMGSWDYHNENILELKFEHFIQDLTNHWRNIFDFLGIQLDHHPSFLITSIVQSHNKVVQKLNKRLPGFYHLYLKANPNYSQLDRLIEFNRFDHRTGRNPGSEDLSHHYRKGISGDWKNYFSQDIKDCFKENWGDLLIKLGYEKDKKW